MNAGEGGFGHRLGQQLACPEGWQGRIVGAVMDRFNRRPTAVALDMLAAKPGERIADVGCGTGAVAEKLLARVPCEVDCIDQSPTMLRAARTRSYRDGSPRFHLGRMGTLPFEDDAFDAVLALNLLYFCDAEGRMLADLRRILRPGGRIVAYVTHRDSMRRWSFVRHGTHRLYDAGALRHIFLEAGFASEALAITERVVAPAVRGLFALAHA